MRGPFVPRGKSVWLGNAQQIRIRVPVAMVKVEVLLLRAADSLVREALVARAQWAAQGAKVAPAARERTKRRVVMARPDRAARADVTSLATNIQGRLDCCYFWRAPRRSFGDGVEVEVVARLS